MQPTRKLFQIILVRDNRPSPSRWFQSEAQAQFYCEEFNRVIDREKTLATYQPVELPVKKRAAFASN